MSNVENKRCEQLAAEYEIIDAHTHIYPEKIAAKAAESIGNFYNYTSRYKGSIAELKAVGKKYGVSGYLVCSVATSPRQVWSINDFIMEQCEHHPEFYGFAALHPMLERPEIEIERIMSLGLLGIKLHPDFQKFNIDAPEAYKIYEAVRGKLPVLMHMGDTRYDFSSPGRLKRVLSDFPDLYVIAAHLGGYRVWDEARGLLKHDNVRFDTSSSLQFMSTENAKRQIHALGVEKCFFGTDYPLWEADREFEAFFRLGLSFEENRKIFAVNFKEFIRDFIK